MEKKDATDASDFTQYATPKELQEKKNIACALLRGVIIRAYSIVNDVANSVAVVPVNSWIDEYGVKDSISSPVLSKELMKRLKIASTETPYLGDAHNKFKRYLWRCSKVYGSKTLQAPCVTVVQSSVFEKSQILFELARKAGDEGSKMKVLYICARVHESTGDPEVTTNLRNWLILQVPMSFTVELIASCLEVI